MLNWWIFCRRHIHRYPRVIFIRYRNLGKTSLSKEEVIFNRKNKLGKLGLLGSFSLGVSITVGLYLCGKDEDEWINWTNNVYDAAEAFRFKAEDVSKNGDLDLRPVRVDLPSLNAAEVREHDTLKNGIWVYYKNGVYDITDYISKHPGGDKNIMMAAGQNLEPFFKQYPVHKEDQILDGMEKEFRIANFVEDGPPHSKKPNVGKPHEDYFSDPSRSELLSVISDNPFISETPNVLLTQDSITPNGLFFVCNHTPVPKVDIENYRLSLDMGTGSHVLSMAEIKSFSKSEILATTQCLKNRSKEMSNFKKFGGHLLGFGAISTARWAGVTLDELLKGHDINIDKVRGKYITFEGLDIQDDGLPYGASIPLDLARQLKNDIIIAYEMNGQAIPDDHGYPVRVIIPGVAGARHVKWLNKIFISSRESQSSFQRRIFKVSNSSQEVNDDNAESFKAINQLPVVSAICEPEEDEVLPQGTKAVAVRGYAFSGGGLGIPRVDVSADGGKTWMEAVLRPNNQSSHRSWAWTLWDAYLPVEEGSQTLELVVKAVDMAYNSQPDHVDALWNKEGVLNNSWHRIKLWLLKFVTTWTKISSMATTGSSSTTEDDFDH